MKQHQSKYVVSLIDADLSDICEITEKTATIWMELGTIHIISTGNENSYYADIFGQLFFCKNYPR